MVGFPLGFMTPGRLGEIGRAFFIEKLPAKQALKLVVIDKVSNNIIVIVIGLMCISAFRQLDFGSNTRILIAVISFMLLALLIAAFFSKSINWIKRFINIPALGRRNVFVILLLAFIFYAIFTGQFILLALSFAQLDLSALFQAIAAVFCIKTLLPVAIGDLGIREGASVFFITKIGGSKEIAFNAALLIFCFNSIIPTLCGLPMIFKLKQRR